MSERTEAVFSQIRAERTYQDKKWGTEFDDKNTVNDWAAYANLYLAKATNMGASFDEQRSGILKAATLLVAALERFDANAGMFQPRHYDVGYKRAIEAQVRVNSQS